MPNSRKRSGVATPKLGSNKSFELSYGKKKGEKNVTINIISALISVLIYIAILVYVFRLEKEHCQCVRDWRHNYIKVIAIIGIIYAVGGSISLHFSGNKTMAVIAGLLALAYFVAMIVYIWAFFTYVGDLHETKCACAVTEMKELHQGMLVLRWIYAVLLSIAVFFLVIGLLMLGSSVF